jgi:hypothetical protein
VIAAPPNAGATTHDTSSVGVMPTQPDCCDSNSAPAADRTADRTPHDAAVPCAAHDTEPDEQHADKHRRRAGDARTVVNGERPVSRTHTTSSQLPAVTCTRYRPTP